ncbi:hypothetical protein [Geitlerinema calcuttense]|uniref:Uncharacterized protein n=1 Tax=Geitlerinema calcuttense NRMC-F 0142 TaxID=2922238 RepID=A0ABT7LV63_9CYAN|nr:hypothetical protein [Geitlerinema calcuttense]MDL5055932.1 hypothetical protein [Geitlerinema calcuttense NRMC-F 0142]
MPNKNRKLILRDSEFVKALSREFVEILRIETERAMQEVPDGAWDVNADEKTKIGDLFLWDETRRFYSFWNLAHELFTVEPLPEYHRASLIEALEREKAKNETRNAEIDAEIERLRSEDAV